MARHQSSVARRFARVAGGVAVAALGLVSAQACSGAGGSTGSTSSSGSGSGGANSGSTVTFSGGGIDPSSGAGGNEACAASSSEANEGFAPADIIVVVDSSGSMSDEVEWTQNAMNSMVSTIVASMIDVHLVMIANPNEICVPAPLGSGSCPADENLPAYRHVPVTVNSTDALDKILSTYDQWKDSLRANATKTIVVVSDDNSDLGASSFASQLVALDPTFTGFKFDAIVSSSGGPDLAFTCTTCGGIGTGCGAGCDPCCGTDGSPPLAVCKPLGAAEGTVYAELVASTGGVIGDLCAQDFDPVFADMATAVVASSTIDCVYDIPDPPPGEPPIAYDKVNVDYTPSPGAEPQPIFYVPGGKNDCTNAGGWYYDDPDNPEQILFCDATCVAVQQSDTGKVDVKYGCATIIAPAN